MPAVADGELESQKRSEDGTQSEKSLQVVAMGYLLPWLVPAGLFALVRQIVLAINNASIQDALLFVALPFAAWHLVAQRNMAAITAPMFVPRFLYAVMTIAYGTYLVRLSADTPLAWSLGLTISSAALAFVFTKVCTSDPGYIPMGSPPSGGYQVAPGTEAVPPVSNPAAGQWQEQSLAKPDVENPSGEARDSESVVSVLTSGAAAAVEGSQESTPLVAAPTYPPYHYSYFCYECHIWKWPRSKHCYKCRRCTDRFDHHCPAVANCVGRRNHIFFVAMLVAFIAAEYFFVRCSLHYLGTRALLELSEEKQKWLTVSDTFAGHPVTATQKFLLVLQQALSAEPWLVAITIFLSFQLSWEVPLLVFHCYCVCVNLTTNEFATWRKNPLLFVETPPGPGRPFSGKKFVSPYNKGLVKNVTSFFVQKELE